MSKHALSLSKGTAAGMIFWVYMLACADGRYYTGHTNDLEKRLAEHTAGLADAFTRDRRPVRLVFCEEFRTRD